MPINIPLLHNWKIKSDSYQYLLVKDKGDREFIQGYYTSFENAVQGFIDLKIRGFDSSSIHSLLESIKSLQTALNKALQPLKLRVGGKNEC